MFLNIFNCLLIGDLHVHHQEFQNSRSKSEFKILQCLIKILMGEEQFLFPSKIIFGFSALQGKQSSRFHFHACSSSDQSFLGHRANQPDGADERSLSLAFYSVL